MMKPGPPSVFLRAFRALIPRDDGFIGRLSKHASSIVPAPGSGRIGFLAFIGGPSGMIPHRGSGNVGSKISHLPRAKFGAKTGMLR
jgi:hypothetical protein